VPLQVGLSASIETISEIRSTAFQRETGEKRGSTYKAPASPEDSVDGFGSIRDGSGEEVSST
jgi:hypothetical protein